MVPETHRFDRADWIAFVLAAILIVWQVFFPPSIGLADNGDFPKITGRFSLHPDAAESDLFFHYATNRYVTDSKYYWNPGFYNSEALLASIAVTAGRAWRGDGSFDIRFLGALHAALYLAAFGLALPLFHSFRPWPRRILIVLSLLIFGDVMYSEYYNSFYTDTASLLFVLLAAVLFLRAMYLPPARSRPAPFFLLCAGLFLLSKAQHAPLAIPAILLSQLKGALVWRSRPILSRALATGFLTACGLFSFFSTPRGYSDPALFTVIFTAVLPSAQDPSSELRELGLNDSYLRYMGMGAYSEGSPMLDWNWGYTFTERTSYRKLASFYLRHPWRGVHVLGLGLAAATYQRPFYIGNFDKSAGFQRGAKTYRLSLWSTFKLKIFGNRGWIYLGYFLGFLAIVIRRNSKVGLVLGLMAALALAVGAMADAAETTRHLLIFNLLLDLTVFCAVATLLAPRNPEQYSLP